jgi:cytochrome o ubiquinol oxidase subunit 2
MDWSTVFLPSKWRTLSPKVASAPMLLLFLAGCSGGILEPQGPIGAANTKIIYNALAIMLVIVLPTIIATLAFAWWFRGANPRAQYRPDWVYSGRIELLVWGIPLLVIMFLGGVIWTGSHKLDPYRPIESQRKPTEVRSSLSIGNGFSSTPIRGSRASMSWSFPPGRRCILR